MNTYFMGMQQYDAMDGCTRCSKYQQWPKMQATTLKTCLQQKYAKMIYIYIYCRTNHCRIYQQVQAIGL